jgi:hypothetical protein
MARLRMEKTQRSFAAAIRPPFVAYLDHGQHQQSDVPTFFSWHIFVSFGTKLIPPTFQQARLLQSFEAVRQSGVGASGRAAQVGRGVGS